MKIVFFSNNIQNTKHFRTPLIEFLNKKKHKIYLITFDKKNQKTQLSFKKYFDKVYNINVTNINILSLIKSVIIIYKILNFIKPNIILSFTLQANIVSSILSKITTFKFILNFTGLGSYFISGNRYLRYVLKFTLKLSKYFIFQNKSDLNFFFDHDEIHKKKISIIPSLGIKIVKSQKKVLRKKSTNFLMISRIIKDKGIIEYMKASKFFKKNKKIKFFLAGDFDKTNPSRLNKVEFKSLIKYSNVIYLGHIKNIQRVMQNYSCIVLPSYREGLSKTLLEAGAQGIPAITSDVPGCNDIIQNKVNGLLCKPRSSESLIKSINFFLKMNYKTKKKLSRKAHEIVLRKFNQDIVLKNYYKKILNVSKY